MKKLVPGRSYTYAELAEMRDDPDLAGLAIQGYVWRANLDGTLQLVHWSKASGGGRSTNRTLEKPEEAFVAGWDDDPWDLEPIRKRTPQERKESLIKKWWQACKEAGTVPGLTDEQITDIVGVDWKTGETEMTAEVVERLAAAMLQDAERKAS